jgi:radical SAM protein with 4Fe4S-binding SPASM domain
MEFVDLSRYLAVQGTHLSPFERLRAMDPVWMTQDLELADVGGNIDYARSLAARGLGVAPIRRMPPSANFIDRQTFPRRVILEMTSRCNFLCRMCPQQNLKRPRMDMPGDVYRRVIDEIDSYGIEGLWLYHLGESLLHPEFRENIRHISGKRNLGVIWMSTNGQYFNEENIRCVLASNVDFINFSMHAVTEETYRTVAPEGDFQTVRDNLETFYRLKTGVGRSSKPFLHCQMIEQRTTRFEVDAFIAEHYRRADIVSVNMLEYVNLPNNEYGFRQRDRKPLTSCLRVSRNDCFICSNGHVTLCDAAYNGELYLGNINENSVHRIWNGEERKCILERNRSGRMGEIGFCQKCTDYDI